MTRGEGAGAPPGNKNAKKLTTEELCKVAYEQYCAHLALGKSKRSWVFEHPDLELTARGFENYLKNEIDFPPKKRELAESKGYAKWEQITEDSATGKDNGRSNTASLQMVMRNKFGWDKVERDKTEIDSSKKEALEKLMNHLDKPHSDSSMATNSDTSR